MKVRFSQLATDLSIHPLNLLNSVYPLVGSLSDCWPEIDQEFEPTLRALLGQHETSRDEGSSPERVASRRVDVPLDHVDDSSAKVLEKLWRQERWGVNSISWDTMRNHSCRGINDLRKVVDALVEMDLILTESSTGPYSLNPSQKGRIDRIVQRKLGIAK